MDADAYRLGAVEALREAVPFDAYCWPLTDPETTASSVAVAALPFWDAVPQMLRLQAHKHATLLAEPPVWSPTDRTTPAWTEVFTPHGVTDELTAVFADDFGCWGYVELWRLGGRFTDAERTIVRDRLPSLTEPLRAAQAAAFSAPAPSLGEERDGPAVMVLDPAGEVRSSTVAAQAWAKRLAPIQLRHGMEVPGVVFTLAARAALPVGKAMVRLQVGEGVCLTLQASPMSGGDIAVTFEQSSTGDRIEVLGRACGLTPRERQLLSLLPTGSDTRHLARSLGITEATVQQHFKSVHAKVGVHSRTELVARVSGRVA